MPTEATFSEAVALLDAPEAPSAPAEPTPDSPDAPAPETTPEAPAAPVETPTPVDDEAKLIAELETRKQARQAKQAPNEVAQLRAELAELKAQRSSPALDLKALIKEHGEIEGLRMYGLDPLEFYNGFAEKAKARQIPLTKAEREAAAAREEAKQARESVETYKQTEQQRVHQEATAAKERTYLGVVNEMVGALPTLAKLEPHERLQWTYATMENLDREGHDLVTMTDGELAKMTEIAARKYFGRFTGNDGSGATPPSTQVPTTDGAKTKPAPASLTNDLASQTTGQERDLTDSERRKLAIKMLEESAQ